MKFLSYARFANDLLSANQGTLRSPFRYFLVVTKSCQSRCRYCKIWQEKVTNEMTLEEYEQLAMKSPKLKWLNISGGEPTDRADLVEIVKVFKRHCPDLSFVNFTTNGMRPVEIESMVRAIAALGIAVFHVNVSIDGPAEMHDKIRGVKGSFASSLELLARLRSMDQVKTGVSMTLFPENHQAIEQTVDAIRATIPDFALDEMHLNVAHSSTHFYRNAAVNVDLDEGINESIKKFQSKRSQRSFSPLTQIEKIYLDHTNLYAQTGESGFTCSALMASAYISEKGEIYPCSIWDRSLGNLRDHDYDLSRVLSSALAIETREKIKQAACPGCWTPCEAFSTIMCNLPKVIAHVL